MPADGSLFVSESSTDRIFAPDEFRDAMVGYAKSALDAAMMTCDLTALSIEARVALRDAFATTALKRMNSASNAHEMELAVAERRGRAGALEQMTRGMKVIADAMGLAKRTDAFARRTPASEKYSKETLEAFVRGAADQIVSNLRIAWIAIGGLSNRDQLPHLDPRARAVYVSAALGRACGHAVATNLRCVAPMDADFARTMRSAFTDEFQAEFGPAVEQLVGAAQETN